MLSLSFLLTLFYSEDAKSVPLSQGAILLQEMFSNQGLKPEVNKNPAKILIVFFNTPVKPFYLRLL